MLVVTQTPKQFKNVFHKLFPYLKLEFFKEAHTASKGSSLEKMLTEDDSGKFDTALFKIDPEMTVTAFEAQFYKTFQLPVQVFRKSGKIWLETTATDSWTLGQQNQHGEESCRHLGSLKI